MNRVNFAWNGGRHWNVGETGETQWCTVLGIESVGYVLEAAQLLEAPTALPENPKLRVVGS